MLNKNDLIFVYDEELHQYAQYRFECYIPKDFCMRDSSARKKKDETEIAYNEEPVYGFINEEAEKLCKKLSKELTNELPRM